jgi:hypothetical protein
MGQITQYTVAKWTSLGTVVAVRLDGGSRTVIRADGDDVRIAYQRDQLGSDLGGGLNQYFTIKDGEAFVFDPNPLTGTTEAELGYTFYMTCAVNPSATVQVWLQGSTQGAY